MAEEIDDELDNEIDEDDLADGFDETVVVLPDGTVEVPDSDDDEEDEDDENGLVTGASSSGDDEGDDEDVADEVELALDEVLEREIVHVARTKSESENEEVDDEDEEDVFVEPQQADEFRCSSCRLLKKYTQLAGGAKQLCRDCA